ncbi:hypothetical protein [Roseiterribacter gracilis]|uniref:Uncharacterized protein n=1 Tax=Roseiterribacter gracilis TaxID=2812848 RepID=A0A8S8XIW2_9PROT|nr:hypothetical protein TMPK1_33620 [Rhodospirillales bacterium TMPK1]
MTVSALSYARLDDDTGFILPRGVASPGVDPIFSLREEWLRAMANASEKTRARDWLDCERLRLEPAATAPNASARAIKQHKRVVDQLPKARRDEEAALTIEDALTDRILAASPESLPGIVAKLQFIVRYGAPGPETREFPWRELETLLLDLQRLTGTEWVVFDP